MFITLQFPFVDLRRFLQNPPDFVPKRTSALEPALSDYEKIADREFVRCFGHYRLRSYIPKIADSPGKKAGKNEKKVYSATETDRNYHNLKLNDIWQDEYLYASTKRGLRFEHLEKFTLLEGKLTNPRAKVRALRFSPFDPTKKMWSPCMRIETGILYDVSSPLTGNEVIQAAAEFTKLKTCVPVIEREGAGRQAIVVKPTKLQKGTLLEQHQTLAKLIVNGTTAQYIEMVHHDMVMTGEPLLSIHYHEGEIDSFPSTEIVLEEGSPRKPRISYCPLKQPRMGLWLFEMPSSDNGNKKNLVKKRETVRNNTIAIMRYWSELQAAIALRSAVSSNAFEFAVKENGLLQNYVNQITNFILSGSWHGANLNIIRNIIDAHQLVLPNKITIIENTLSEFRTQIAKKLMQVGETKPTIFVSYSHLDAGYLDEMRETINTQYKTQQITYFDDTFINEGAEWERAIRDALENTTIAILLVSDHFLNSSYIKTIEQPKLMDRYKRGKVKIFPVLLEGKLPAKGFLASIQFVNGNQPFSNCAPEEKRNILNNLKGKLDKLSAT